MNKKTRLIISGLSIWTFINLILLFKDFGRILQGNFGTGDYFYPFTYAEGHIMNDEYFDATYYDFTEFLVYAGTPWLVYLLYNFINKAKD